MGPVTVEGAAPFLTQQCVDFVCYLAFHREGVTCDMVKESMWNNGSTPENRTGHSFGEPFQKRARHRHHGQVSHTSLRPGKGVSAIAECEYRF